MWATRRAVNLMSSNIENWHGRDDRWYLKTWYMSSFAQKILVDSDRHKFAMTQDTQKRSCCHCYIWADWFTFHESHNDYYVIYYNGMQDFVRETFNVNIKIAQRVQNIWNFACEQGIWNFIVGKSSLQKKCQTSVIIQEISYSKKRPGDMVQNLASPRLSGRVDSTALDLNSWVNPN